MKLRREAPLLFLTGSFFFHLKGAKLLLQEEREQRHIIDCGCQLLPTGSPGPA